MVSLISISPARGHLGTQMQWASMSKHYYFVHFSPLQIFKGLDSLEINFYSVKGLFTLIFAIFYRYEGCLENSDLENSDLRSSDPKNSDPLGVSKTLTLKTQTLWMLRKLRP